MQRFTSTNQPEVSWQLDGYDANTSTGAATQNATVEEAVANPSSPYYDQVATDLTTIQCALQSAINDKLLTAKTLGMRAAPAVWAPVNIGQGQIQVETERCIAQLKSALKTVQRARRRKIIFAVALGLVYLSMLSTELHQGFSNIWWVFMIVGGNSVMDSRQINAAVESLVDANEPRAVGILAQTHNDFHDRRMKFVTRRALLSLLPQARASDARYFDKAQKQAIITLVDRGDTELKLAALKCLEQTGDTSAVWVVEQAAQYDRSPMVREAAMACLPLLMERIRITAETSTLLRASSTANLQTDQLLRTPSTRETASDSDKLLRPNERNANA